VVGRLLNQILKIEEIQVRTLLARLTVCLRCSA